MEHTHEGLEDHLPKWVICRFQLFIFQGASNEKQHHHHHDRPKNRVRKTESNFRRSKVAKAQARLDKSRARAIDSKGGAMEAMMRSKRPGVESSSLIQEMCLLN